MAIGKLPDADEPGEGESIFAEINITPLTDVFLVMLIIFMVSALAVRQQTRSQQRKIVEQQQEIADDKKSGIKVNLPSGQSQDIDMTKTPLIVTITVEGQVMVAGKQLTGNDVDGLFRAAFARDKNTQIVINADKGVQHGVVVNIMNRAKTAGLTKLAIATAGGG
jgi:biopolymer transport protein ExbD